MAIRIRHYVSFRSLITVGLVLLCSVSAVGLRQNLQEPRWITAWSTSQQGLGTMTVTNATVRMIARVTLPGEAIRVRFDNTFGTSPLKIGRAFVGHRARNEALVEGSNRQLLFGGSESVVVPVAGTVTSDSVAVPILAYEDIAVSLYIPEANVRPSQHGGALTTSYVSANGSGDVTTDEVPLMPGRASAADSPFTATTASMLWLKSIDVLNSSSTGAVVAIGDSITDGSCSTIDAHDRWLDWVGVRLALAGIPKAVLNEGIGGNTITRKDLRPPASSTPGLERLDRDVFSHYGVTHVILFEGTNDIRREASAEQVIAGMKHVIAQVKSRDLRIIGTTIIPRHNYPASGDNTGWDSNKTMTRRVVNEWIRTEADFDGVLDFDRAMRDPLNPDLNYPSFHCDGIHPNPRGYYEMAKTVNLDMLSNNR